MASETACVSSQQTGGRLGERRVDVLPAAEEALAEALHAGLRGSRRVGASKVDSRSGVSIAVEVCATGIVAVVGERLARRGPG